MFKKMKCPKTHLELHATRDDNDNLVGFVFHILDKKGRSINSYDVSRDDARALSAAISDALRTDGLW